jgi:hypothetical protein
VYIQNCYYTYINVCVCVFNVRYHRGVIALDDVWIGFLALLTLFVHTIIFDVDTYEWKYIYTYRHLVYICFGVVCVCVLIHNIQDGLYITHGLP